MSTSDAAVFGPSAEHTAVHSATRPALVALFASTLFVSAFLLFLVQPMIAKLVLPILGGAPMVWNGCVVFFQVILLAGYGYAYAASRITNVRGQLALHVGLILLPLAVLPVVIGDASPPPVEGNPIGWLLLALFRSIGLPFFALSTSASMLQHWFSRSNHASARDPYFLYVASNVGSLLALACYPILMEPLTTLGEQSRMWAGGYMVFVALTGACAVTSWRVMVDQSKESTDVRAPHEETTPLTIGRRVRWIALSFVPSSLMLAVTSYLSTDVAAAPLLWVVPLALFLLTFILAFSEKAGLSHAVSTRVVPLLVVPLVVIMVARASLPLFLILPVHVLAFTFVALLCHSRLALDRPQASRLTEFYFWISCGGMLGGLFNTLVAPSIFDNISEYPLMLAIAGLCLPKASPTGVTRNAVVRDVAAGLVVGALTASILAYLIPRDVEARLLAAAIGVPALLAFGQRRRPIGFGLSIGAMLLASSFAGAREPTLHTSRTFFGVYRVNLDRSGQYRALSHGTTLHGMQALDPAERLEPLSYYHREGPFGQMFTALSRTRPPREIAVIGLGVGTLGAYAEPEQAWTFFEIDPAVERIARNSAYFTYLDACGARCRVVIGDARLSLKAMTDRTYDLIVLDAFSSDAIPVHLLTHEAVELYLSRLAPGGTLALHISNRHLALAQVVAQLAASHRLTAFEWRDQNMGEWAKGQSGSHWVMLGRQRSDLASLEADDRWTALSADASNPLWTDDFSNILTVLRFR